MRWVGIDEAGYGPNLGPLVMSAVVAEGPADRPPDLWGDLAATVGRAGSPDGRLWVDDSKLLYRGGRGRDRLDAATLALLDAAGRPRPATLGGLLAALDAGDLETAELLPLWCDEIDPPWPGELATGPARAFDGAAWRIVEARSVVVGPAQFNRELERAGTKSAVHASAFARLLCPAWDATADGLPARIRADKHGGRHFYAELLAGAIPGAWIDRGPEGPALSQYIVRDGGRRLELRLEPRADAGDGLVALASIVSKAVRERWMDAFNAHWCARLPGLRPTAGYPVDAARFRAAIEPECRRRGLDVALWWRAK